MAAEAPKRQKRDAAIIEFIEHELPPVFTAEEAAHRTPSIRSPHLHTSALHGVPVSESGWRRRLRSLEERGVVERVGVATPGGITWRLASATNGDAADAR